MHTTKNDVAQGRERRRRHSDEFKAAVVAECARPGVSIARVALDHGLNANLLRRWVVTGERSMAPVAGAEAPLAAPRMIESVPAAFVAVPIEAPPAASTAAIEVELRRGPMTVKVIWPMTASTECGAWLRELMR